jgi:hypothetical protein
MAFSTREEWLMGAVEELRPFLNGRLPAKIRVTCGFPSGGNRGNVLGECVSPDRSADGHWEISIHPKLDKPRDVFAVLIHELCHTLPNAFNHSKTFQSYAIHMKLTAPSGNFKATAPMDEDDTFNKTYGALIQGLEAYPHASLGLGAKPKQQTRLLKAVCPSCGYTIRLTQKWASQGLPTCGVDGDTFNIATEE